MKHRNPTPHKHSTQAKRIGDSVCWTWEVSSDPATRTDNLVPTAGVHGPTVCVTFIRLEDNEPRQISFCERCKTFVVELTTA